MPIAASYPELIASPDSPSRDIATRADRKALVKLVQNDFQQTLRCAVEYEDRPSGLMSIVYDILSNILRIRIAFFVFDTLPKKICGISEGWLIMTVDGKIQRLTYFK